MRYHDPEKDSLEYRQRHRLNKETEIRRARNRSKNKMQKASRRHNRRR
jgi:hypothetical protein